MLKIKNLVVGYDEIIAIRDVSLEVQAGEIVTVIGSNGAGKSTLLRAVSGMIPVRSGAIYFEGEKINGLSPAKVVSRGITQVPEGRGIFPKLTVGENLKIGAFSRIMKTKIWGQKVFRKELQRDLESIYAYFPVLKEREHQYGGTLSGGEQQMLAIARGLMARPKIMLLDEPSLGLAPLLVGTIMKMVMEIHKSGLSILLVEQKAFLALKLTERGCVLENGKIVLEGKTDKLLDNEYVRSAYLG